MSTLRTNVPKVTLISIFIVSVMFIPIGCVHFEKTGTQIKVAPDFFKAKPSKIAIAVTPQPIVGYAYKNIKGELSSTVKRTDSLDAGVASFVRVFDYSSFYRAKYRFGDELTKRGMQIELLDDEAIRLNDKIYQYLQRKNTNWEAVRPFMEQVSADYLILFFIKAAGFMEDNLLPPFRHRYGLFSVNGYLLDLRNGAIEWKYDQNLQGVPISGEWQQPPEYPNVTKAINEAVAKSVNELFESFFRDEK